MLRLLSSAVKVVAFLFSAFSFYIKDIAPPLEGGSNFVYGGATVLCLALLLLVTRWVRTHFQKTKRTWTIIATLLFLLSCGTFLGYRNAYSNYVIGLPPEKPANLLIGGGKGAMRPKAKEYMVTEKLSVAEVVYDFASLSKVWEDGAIRKAESSLVSLYLAFILFLSATIFSLAELLGQAGIQDYGKAPDDKQPDPQP